MSKKTLVSPMPGIVTEVLVEEGVEVMAGKELLILEAMKMENAIIAPTDGIISTVLIHKGDIVDKDEVLLTYEVIENAAPTLDPSEDADIVNRPDRFTELRSRREKLTDRARPSAVEKRRKKGQNTARENIRLLTDPDTFKEYGGLIVAAQLTRRSEEDLIDHTPADGLITGLGEINSTLIRRRSSCLIMAYDFTVLAGTQGTMNHMKMDRVIEVAKNRKLPVVLFAEGGGGRPGDVDMHTIAGLFISTFVEYASLRNVVPTISIVAGYCFAGNAALAGSSDVIIATKDVSIGMGGPAMIEGGGLGKFHPKEVGPFQVQIENGVIDILVENETEAIIAAKKYLSFWQGRLNTWEVNEQNNLQSIIPANRKRTFDIRSLLTIFADRDSILELRPHYGKGMLTCFGRVEGIPVGILANDSSFEAGAITAENAIKAASFVDLCNRYNIPIVSFIDTPGIMVGPESEKQGTVKHAGSLFVAGAQFKPPFMSIVIRKAYGLGAMAMMGGSTRKSEFTIAWPSGEFGAMGLEGAVQLGYRKELEAISDIEERTKLYNKMVDEAYERGKALSMATMLEIDNVIEPVESRSWVLMAIKNHNL